MRKALCFLILLSFSFTGFAQDALDTSGGDATLRQCVRYAMAHQTTIRQSVIDQQIAESQIRDRLSEWFPQIGLTGNYQRNFQLQTTVFDNQARQIGSFNTSYLYLGLTQTIFNRDVLLAQQSARDVRIASKQQTVNRQIDVAASVSKAFYDVLLSRVQISLYDSDMVLLDRGYKDAYNQYKAGLVDKTDYQRASISLNNNKAQRKSALEQLKSKYAVLKLLMTYPADSALRLVYDSASMESEVALLDTGQRVDPNNRIEYKQLQTDRRLLLANLKYYQWAYLPSLSGNANYNLNYYNDQFSKLYNTMYPNSYAGVTLAFPIFQGTKRVQEIRIAKLQVERIDLNERSLKDSISAQYVQALSSYKANLNNYFLQRDNLKLAREVYDVIQLQYRAGIKTYLEVVTANNDLFAAQINYANALFEVLSNKIDVQRALGTLTY